MSDVHIYRVTPRHYVAARTPSEACVFALQSIDAVEPVHRLGDEEMATLTRFLEGHDAEERTFAEALAADLVENEPPFWFSVGPGV